MRVAQARVARAVLFVLIGVGLAGCSGQGIRKLESIETRYYAALNAELKRSRDLLAEERRLTQTNEEQAIREAGRLQMGIQASKAVYAVREMLTAPSGDSAEFIQATRNSVILYHLVEMAVAQNAGTAATLGAAAERRRQLGVIEEELIGKVQGVIETEKVLHNYLTQGAGQEIRDVVAEVRRQLIGFNDEIKKADQENPFVKTLAERAKVVQESLEKADSGLGKFMDAWMLLNRKEK